MINECGCGTIWTTHATRAKAAPGEAPWGECPDCATYRAWQNRQAAGKRR